MISVLIIEDDLMLAEIHKQFVDQVEGYKVTDVANDGEQALDLLRKNKYDLIILDVYMPIIDGFKLLEIIRNENIVVDTILVTAAKRSDQVDLALRLGAIDYLVKPFEFNRLKTSLELYKKRKNLITTKDTVLQNDIDIILERNRKIEVELPKGLNKHTLSRIERLIASHKGEVLKSDFIAKELDLSKVSIRKYLEHLSDLGFIEIITEYGTRGRPSYQYRIL